MKILKKYLFLLVICILAFIFPFYLPEARWLFAGERVEKGSEVKSCSPDFIFCMIFKVTIRGDPPYRSGYLRITNMQMKKHVEINNFFMDINYDILKNTQFIWKSHQLDVFIDDKSNRTAYNYFFKDLNDLKVIIHSNIGP